MPNKKHEKSNRNKPIQPKNEEEKWRKMHSKFTSVVLEDADPLFRGIRQRLNALNLERISPKEKIKQTKCKSKSLEPVDNPPLDGLAGKTLFIVQVGDVTNLYKPSNQAQLETCIMIDLHGYIVEEALNRLDESLAEWVETAMRRSCPFVIAVKLVCGNDQVSNAPKILYS